MRDSFELLISCINISFILKNRNKRGKKHRYFAVVNDTIGVEQYPTLKVFKTLRV